MVDAPASIGVHSTGLAIIPKGVLLSVWVEASEHILETPGHGLLVGPLSIFVKADMVLVFFRAMHIHRPRSDIHVSTPNSRSCGKKVFGEIPS